MKQKRSYFFVLSTGLPVKVSIIRFYFRLWFHFPLSGFVLSVIKGYPGCNSFDLALVWLPVLEYPKL